MHIRRRHKLFEATVRYKGSRVARSFIVRSHATKWAKKTLAEMEKGTYTNRDKLYSMQLRDLLTLYYDHAKDTYRSETTRFTLSFISRQSLGKCILARLDGVKLANFKKQMLKTKAPSTVRKYLLLISRAISVGIKELGIPFEQNPVSMVSLPADPKHRDRILTATERATLFKACFRSRSYAMGPIVELAYETLCRRNELLTLNYNDCNLMAKEALVRITKNGEPRRIGLSNRAVEIIKTLPRSMNGSLFTMKSVSSFEKSFRRIVATCNLNDFHFHDLRHCGATTLAEQGWSTIELMAQGGWSSADMVKRYASISGKHLAKRFEIVR